MPFLFRYKEFTIRIWFCNEERRRHVHAVSGEANIKIWLEPEIAIASIKGRVRPNILHELLEEVKRNEQICNNAWDRYLA